MATLTTKHMGITLKNPLILGACNLSNDLEKLKEAEAAGVAAVVYRSLFEEQIQMEDNELSSNLEAYDNRNAEMINLFPKIEHGGPKEHIHNLKQVVEALYIPVSVKLSPFYTNVLKTINDMDEAGADAFILFNRLFEPDIDVEVEKHVSPWNLSTHSDHRLSIRYIGLTHGNLNASVAANNGIYEGIDMVKMILAGASAVEVVSAFYHNGVGHAP